MPFSVCFMLSGIFSFFNERRLKIDNEPTPLTATDAAFIQAPLFIKADKGFPPKNSFKVSPKRQEHPIKTATVTIA